MAMQMIKVGALEVANDKPFVLFGGMNVLDYFIDDTNTMTYGSFENATIRSENRFDELGTDFAHKSSKKSSKGQLTDEQWNALTPDEKKKLLEKRKAEKAKKEAAAEGGTPAKSKKSSADDDDSSVKSTKSMADL